MSASSASRTRMSSVSPGILVCRGTVFFPMTQVLPDRENRAGFAISAITCHLSWPTCLRMLRRAPQIRPIHVLTDFLASDHTVGLALDVDAQGLTEFLPCGQCFT